MSGILVPRSVSTLAKAQHCTAGTAAAGYRGLVGLYSFPRVPASFVACSGRGAWLPEASPPPLAQLQWGWQARAVSVQRPSQRGLHATAAVDVEVSQPLRAGEYDASQIQVGNNQTWQSMGAEDDGASVKSGMES